MHSSSSHGLRIRSKHWNTRTWLRFSCVFVHVWLNDPHRLNTLTSHFSPCSPSLPTVTLTAPEVQAGQTLYGSSSGYSVLEFIGEGCFGKVAKCQSLATRETVAVKILKKDTDFIQDTEKEVDFWTPLDFWHIIFPCSDFVCSIRVCSMNCWHFPSFLPRCPC